MENKLKAKIEALLKRYPFLAKAKRIIIGIIGGVVLVCGLAMMVLPGPAFIVIPAGLAILALEFEWSRRLLRKVRAFFRRSRARYRARKRASGSACP